MPKLKIVHPGFEEFSGMMGETEFEGGVSVDVVSVSEARRLACSLRVIDLNTGENPSATQEMVSQRDFTLEQMKEASVAKSRSEGALQGDAEAAVRKRKRKPKTGTSEAVKAPKQKPESAPAMVYDFTRESLGLIADSGGLEGIRELADKYDVRGPSIRSIIEALVARKESAENKS